MKGCATDALKKVDAHNEDRKHGIEIITRQEN
jgi:hypothetical protein